jgi:hypothetical protein
MMEKRADFRADRQDGKIDRQPDQYKQHRDLFPWFSARASP